MTHGPTNCRADGQCNPVLRGTDKSSQQLHLVARTEIVPDHWCAAHLGRYGARGDAFVWFQRALADKGVAPQRVATLRIALAALQRALESAKLYLNLRFRAADPAAANKGFVIGNKLRIAGALATEVWKQI